MLYTIVRKCTNLDKDRDVNLEEIMKEGSGVSPDKAEKARKRMQIRGKIQSVAKMNKMFTTLREESDMILKIKNISPDGKLPRGLLLDGKPAIKHAAR